MVLYECKVCSFSTSLKSNYNRHTKTKYHKEKIDTINETSIVKISTDAIQKFNESSKETNDNVKITCKYCNKIFKHQSSLPKHIKYTCKQSKDEDLKELVRLLNLQLEQQRSDSEKKDKIMEKKDKIMEKKDKQLENQQKQIDKLMDKLQVPQQINNNTNIQNNNFRLSYKETDVSHLTDTDYRTAINNIIMCVKTLIEIVHLDPEHPENMNIYISNLKDKYIMVYTGETWELKNREYEMNHLYDHNEMLLSEWLSEHGTQDLRERFERYLSRKEGAINMIHEEIKLMLYNKRHLALCE